MRRLGGTGAWSADDFTDNPPGRRRIWFQIDVPWLAGHFDAVQVREADPHTWNVECRDSHGWKTAEEVKVDDPTDVLGTVLQLLKAVLTE